MFISHARNDAADYALRLRDKLEKLRFEAYVDRLDTNPGKKTPEVMFRRLRRSKSLVVIASHDSLKNPNVLEEIEEFPVHLRPVQIIDVDGLAGSAIWYGKLEGVPRPRETLAALKAKRPSSEIVRGVASSLKFVRPERARAFATLGAIVSMATLAVIVVIAWQELRTVSDQVTKKEAESRELDKKVRAETQLRDSARLLDVAPGPALSRAVGGCELQPSRECEKALYAALTRHTPDSV